MLVSFHLVVNKRGSVKAVVNKPSLGYDEIAIAIRLDVPKGLFEKPQLQAAITIPETAAAPHQVTCKMQDNIRDAIQQAAGMEVRLTLLNPEQQ